MQEDLSRDPVATALAWTASGMPEAPVHLGSFRFGGPGTGLQDVHQQGIALLFRAAWNQNYTFDTCRRMLHPDIHLINMYVNKVHNIV